jgi:hypothetical protein
LVDNRFKLITEDISGGKFQLYDLIADSKEARDVSEQQSDVFARMKAALVEWDASMDASFHGKDYPEEKVSPPDPEPVNWYETPQYQPFLAEWKQRWEFKSYLERAQSSPRPKNNSKKAKK